MTDIETQIKAAMVRFRSLPLNQDRRMAFSILICWVIGEMLIEHPDMTREQAERLFDQSLAGGPAVDPVDPVDPPPLTRR